MSKRLEEIQNELAISKGFEDFNHLLENTHEMETIKSYFNKTSTRYAREVAQESLERASEKTTAQQPVVMRNVLADLRNQLERSRQLTQSFDDGEARWRDGMENGLETAIELLEDTLTKHFS